MIVAITGVTEGMIEEVVVVAAAARERDIEVSFANQLSL
jgi:hypothetical protein